MVVTGEETLKIFLISGVAEIFHERSQPPPAKVLSFRDGATAVAGLSLAEVPDLLQWRPVDRDLR